jgi:hypothetical protein
VAWSQLTLREGGGVINMLGRKYDERSTTKVQTRRFSAMSKICSLHFVEQWFNPGSAWSQNISVARHAFPE